MAGADQPIIVKKIIKGGHGHHGGAWKVAYADFVTAMMAFFLLLWLLNSVTQEQLEGISNYFAPVSTSQSTSGSGDILAGKVLAEEGSSTTDMSRPSVTTDLPSPKAGSGGEGEGEGGGPQSDAEQESFDSTAEDLKQALEGLPELAALAESMLIDQTSEGLRIQVVDQDGMALFQGGSDVPTQQLRDLLKVIGTVVKRAPQDIAVSGHTDASPFNRNGYTNWELSADRANTARRLLSEFGVPEPKVRKVQGLAATEPLLPEAPEDAKNRRISITLLKGTGIGPDGKPIEFKEELPGLNAIRRRQLLEETGIIEEGKGAVSVDPAFPSRPTTPPPGGIPSIGPSLMPEGSPPPQPLPGLDSGQQNLIQPPSAPAQIAPEAEPVQVPPGQSPFADILPAQPDLPPLPPIETAPQPAPAVITPAPVPDTAPTLPAVPQPAPEPTPPQLQIGPSTPTPTPSTDQPVPQRRTPSGGVSIDLPPLGQ